jgi:hypothetical protein
VPRAPPKRSAQAPNFMLWAGVLSGLRPLFVYLGRPKDNPFPPILHQSGSACARLLGGVALAGRSEHTLANVSAVDLS